MWSTYGKEVDDSWSWDDQSRDHLARCHLVVHASQGQGLPRHQGCNALDLTCLCFTTDTRIYYIELWKVQHWRVLSKLKLPSAPSKQKPGLRVGKSRRINLTQPQEVFTSFARLTDDRSPVTCLLSPCQGEEIHWHKDLSRTNAPFVRTKEHEAFQQSNQRPKMCQVWRQQK